METLAAREREALLGYARQASPLEACGVVINGLVHPVPNLTEERNKFEMDQQALMTIVYECGVPEAIWHSHPEGQQHPSNADCAYHPEGFAMLIVTLDAVWEWDLSTGIPLRRGEL